MAPPHAAMAAPAGAGGGHHKFERFERRLGSRITPPAMLVQEPHLRLYQRDLVDEIASSFRAGARSVLAVLPTAGGKTEIFCSHVSTLAASGARVLLLGHRQEIVEQISGALARRGVAHGAIVAGARESVQPVQVASVATMARRAAKYRDAFDFVVIDEAHHAVAGQWQTILATVPGARILGVTATPERLDGRGLGDVFERMILGPSVAELISGGFLSSCKVYAPAAAPDLSGVRTRAGDFEIEGLRKAMSGVVVESAIVEYARICAGVPAVAFCVDRAHSDAVAKRFVSHGFRAAHVDGDTPASERRRLGAGLGAGELDVLCNCGLISEGVDVPAIGAAILLRPTQSLALYLQQVGRALRLAPGKDRAMILDFAGSALRHGLPDEDRDWSLESKVRRRRGEKGSVPHARHCETCGVISPHEAHVCVECGHDLLTPAERVEIEARLREIELDRIGQHIRSMSYNHRIEWAGDDEQRLRMVAAACGYKPGWVFHRLVETRGVSA